MKPTGRTPLRYVSTISGASPIITDGGVGSFAEGADAGPFLKCCLRLLGSHVRALNHEQVLRVVVSRRFGEVEQPGDDRLTMSGTLWNALNSIGSSAST
jgi:hypothetical protein